MFENFTNEYNVDLWLILPIFTGCDSASKACEVSQDRVVSTPSVVNFL